jgi:hypothetical protein
MPVEGFELIPKPIFPGGDNVELTDKTKRANYLVPSIDAVNPKQLTPVELHQLYAGTSVPQHRYLAPSLAAAVSSPAIALDPAKWFAGIGDVNLAKLVKDWLHTTGSTAYEQLNDVGLDLNTGQLTGVVTVKQNIGYSGGPSTAGSREFVAFWADWGSGFQYQGTTSAAVHDYNGIPAAGLEYKVFLPVNLFEHEQPCSEGLRTVKVRAVLSWNTPPSITNPNAPVVWGNSLEGLLLIPSPQVAPADHPVLFPNGRLPSNREQMESSGFPQEQTELSFRREFRLQPFKNGVTSE